MVIILLSLSVDPGRRVGEGTLRFLQYGGWGGGGGWWVVERVSLVLGGEVEGWGEAG